MKDWKTTIAGALLAGALVLQTHLQAGHALDDWKTWLAPVCIGIFGFLARDKKQSNGL